METLIVHAPDAAKAKAVKTVLKAMGVAYEKKKNGVGKKGKKEKAYNPEFVKKILDSQKEYEQGRFTIIKTEDLWK